MSRVAIVTGAGRGIGAATAAALAADGWRVLAVDRGGDDPRLPYAMASAADLDASVAAANRAADASRGAVAGRPDDAEAGGERAVRAAVADAADAEAMAAVVAEAEAWGELEAVVANAGVIAGGAPAWELSPEEEDAVVEVCLRGTMVAARVGIPALLRRPAPRQGRFVATASAASLRGLPGLAAYCAAKAGVSGFIAALAADLRGTGVTAAAVAPGSTDTAILAESARLYDLEGAPSFAPQQPIERLIDPAEIAAMVAFLLGPGGAAVTGATLPVDGGLSI
ncbi:MAG: SDR family mycofactocin-dependent oxidoreductase [Solirubrobacterales bacterium 70-9]|nr:MAG: SDR family mycofactocin-dependent oxidoreductase [Solirubrobacterales bacterium 70-9]